MTILGNPATAALLGSGRGIVDDLIVDRLVGCPKAGVVDGQESELGWDDARCQGTGHFKTGAIQVLLLRHCPQTSSPEELHFKLGACMR